MVESKSTALALLVVGLFANSAAFAASGVYLKIEGVAGEATSRAPQGQIEIMSFSWGASQSGAAQGTSSASGTGGGAGKVSVQDLSVTRAAPAREQQSGMATGKRQQTAVAAVARSEAAPIGQESMRFVVDTRDNPTAKALMAACASGAPIPRAVLAVEGQRYDLRDLVVTSCDAVGGGEQRKIVTRTGHVTLMK